MCTLEDALLACANGSIPPNIGLMRLLLAARNEYEARKALQERLDNTGAATPANFRLNRMMQLWQSAPAAFDTVKRMDALAGAGTDDWGSTFDEAARISPEAAVALYSLGSATVLDEITRELVGCMRAWNLLNPTDCVLDFGCGTGRVAALTASLVRLVVAVDVSAEMARLARQRTNYCGNVFVVQGNGEALAFLADAAFDVVVAIDSFPYVVQSGGAAKHLAETARVLKAGGRLLIMNYSYCGDLASDRRELEEFAREFRFAIFRNGTGDLSLWDGRAFLLAKGEGPCRAHF
ncbi:MAG TPA: class I SAM-dependent methyltransferase [Rhizomicrobium sp.]|nr:class I SAM-dependent methyltransferase [Rhizomicrobium sp.]